MQYLAAREGQQFARQRRGSFRLFTNARKAPCHLNIVAILLNSQFRPAQDCAHHIVEVMRDSSGQLADSLELLRLPQLPLHGAQLGHILRNHFEFACTGKSPNIQPHSNQAAVATPPFGFRSVHLTFSPACADELNILFGEAENVSRQIQRPQILRGCAAQNT